MIRLFIAPVSGSEEFVVAAEFSDGTIAPVTMPGSREKAERLLAAVARVAELHIAADRRSAVR